MKTKKARKVIIYLALCAVILANVFSAGSYQGNDTGDSGGMISRAEFTVMVMEQLFGDIPTGADLEPFDDVAVSSPYYAHVANARALGVVSGVGNNRFVPEAYLTHQEMFMMLYNALDALNMLPDYQTDQWIEFDDWDEVAEYAIGPIQTLAKMDMIQGSVLNPAKPVARIEAAASLAIAMAGGYQKNNSIIRYLEERNNIGAVFAEHSSVRTESSYYGLDVRGQGGEDFTQTNIFIRRSDGINTHVDYYFEDGYSNGYTIEKDNVYFYYASGEYNLGHYGKYAFFDDGLFDSFFLPYITERINRTPEDGEVFISDTSENNIRTLVSHIDISIADVESGFGVSSGILETIYELEAESGFMIRVTFYAKADGQSRLLAETRMIYGHDDAFPQPEYVTRCKDMGDVRTVNFIMPGGEVITHAVPKTASLVPYAFEDYEFYEDPEHTVAYDAWSGDYPDEMNVYVRRQEALVIYTSMKDTLIMALVEDFKSKHPDIVVDVRIDGAGNLMAQIESERTEGKILADIIWTSEIPDFYYMKDEGLLLQYRPAGADDVLNPLEGTDDYFIPARLGTMGIAYNTDLIQTPPTSWRSLLGAEYTDGFAFANPETSGTALMAVVLLTEAFGEEFFRELRANGAFVGQGSTWVVDAVASGEIAAGLAVDYITFDKAISGAPIAMAYPDEMIVIPSPVAIFKDSTNTAAAQKFANYLITPDAQLLVNNNGTLPVRSGIPAPGEYNIPPVTEAMERAIEVNEAEWMLWGDGPVRAFIDIMRG